MVMGEVYRDVEKCDTCNYVEGLFDSHWRSVSLRNVYLYFFLQAFTRNPRIHAESRTYKNIQGFMNTLDILESS